MAFILASGSPRRRELLEMFGLAELRVLKPVRDEVLVPGRGPAETVMALSAAKAEEIAEQAEAGDVVIAADTVVFLDGEILGKPKSRQEAGQMLRRLSGREHSVFSGVTVSKGEKSLTRAEQTKVRFRPLSDREIGAYIETGEPMDKAGAYGVQGVGSLFVEGIEGDFFNVMGLPLCLLGKMLEELGARLL